METTNDLKNTSKSGRLIYLRTILGLDKPEEMAQELQIDSANYRKMESGSRPIGPRITKAIEKEFNITPGWLDTGDGDIFVKRNNEFRTKQYPTKRLSASEAQSDNALNLNMWWVSSKVEGGFINGLSQGSIPPQIQRVSFPLIQNECFCFELEGVNMYPNFMPGSFVVCTIVKDWNWLRKGKTYVFATNEKLTINIHENTRDEVVYLSSVNKRFNPDETLAYSDLLQVFNIEFKIERPQENVYL